jgi:hypothetical protein
LFKIKIGETQMNFITKIFTDYSEFTKFLNDAGGLGGVVNKANIIKIQILSPNHIVLLYVG